MDYGAITDGRRSIATRSPGSRPSGAYRYLRCAVPRESLLELYLRLRLDTFGSGEAPKNEDLLRCGCASVSRGTSETISVATTPSGAGATVSGLDQPFVCTSLCAFTTARSADLTMSIAREGYEPRVIPLTKEVTITGGAGFAGNLRLGGVVGMGVDAVTGAAMDRKPNPVIVTLRPIAPPPPPKLRRPNAPPRPAS